MTLKIKNNFIQYYILIKVDSQRSVNGLRIRIQIGGDQTDRIRICNTTGLNEGKEKDNTYRRDSKVVLLTCIHAVLHVNYCKQTNQGEESTGRQSRPMPVYDVAITG